MRDGLRPLKVMGHGRHHEMEGEIPRRHDQGAMIVFVQKNSYSKAKIYH